MNNFPIGIRLSIAFSIVIVIAMLIMVPSIGYIVDNALGHMKQTELEAISKSIRSDLEKEGDLATVLASSIANIPQVQSAFASEDRSALHNAMMPVWHELKSQYDFRQFQFHKPPATSFLRLHKPEKYGDDLSSFRHTVTETNHAQIKVQGLEKGVAGLGIRGISPVSFEGKHIGSIEFGASLGDNFFKEFKEKYDIEVALYIQKDGNYSYYAGSNEFEAPITPQERLNLTHDGALQFQRTEQAGQPVSVLAFAISDYSGKAIGVIEIIQDRTKYVTILRNIKGAIILISLILLAISITVATMLSRQISRGLSVVVEDINKIAEGDLTVQVHVEGKDEIATLSAAMNNFATKVRGTLGEIINSIQKLNVASRTLFEATQLSNESVNKQKSDTEQVSLSMQNLSTAVDGVTKNISQTSQAILEAAEESDLGRKIVKSTVNEIDILAKKIGESAGIIQDFDSHSQEINNVLVVIQSIAEQTNLLALNAAIEAARAGEQGRGFAVVADEVRTLAGRTHASTEEINTMVNKLQQGSLQAIGAMHSNSDQACEVVKQANQTESSLDKIAQSVDHISDMSVQIAAASEEQSNMLSEVVQNISSIDDSASVISAQSDQITESSQELIQLADTLQRLADQFKISVN